MLTEEVKVSGMTVDEFCSISVRTTHYIYRDEEEIAVQHHRHVVHPGDDMSGEDIAVQDVAGALWSPEVVRRWEKHKAAALLSKD